ncbi:MAG: type IV secretion system DNA-binding domain-containing protein [Pseudomonadota bacterium]
MANWFTRRTVRSSKAPRLDKQTRDLKVRADRLFQASPVSKREPAVMAVLFADHYADKHQLKLPLSVRIVLAECIDDLLFEAGLYLPDCDLDTLDIHSDRAHRFRELWRMQISFFEREAETLALLETIVDAVIGQVLGRLALSPACKLALEEADYAEEGPSLRLIDYIEAPDEAIEGIISALFARELSLESMFKLMKRDIERSVAVASGLTPQINHPSDKLILPTKARFDDPSELADRYLRLSPFASFLKADLPVAFPDSARFEHTHILGGSGHGKTQLMSQLILRDIKRAKDEKRSIIIMDSQGDLLTQILSLADVQGSALREKLVVIDPTEFDQPIALNPFTLDEKRLGDYSAADRERVVHSAVSLFEYFFGELLGSELTANQGTAFKFLIRLLVDIPGATLVTLRELMEEPERFRPHINRLTGAARTFFEQEFLKGGYAQTRKQIAKRLWAILSNPVFERLFSSPVNKLDWFSLMQSGHIILINTAKDFLKPEGSRLLGRFLSAQIAQGILERAVIPPDDRTPTMFYIDEAQDQIDQTIEMLLSQGRKYKLGMTLAHQHLDQLSSRQRSELMSNTSIKLAGGLNRKDASAMSGEMHCSADFLQGLRKRDGKTQFAFSMRHFIHEAAALTVPLGLIDQQDTVPSKVVEQTFEINRKRYGRKWEPEVFVAPKPQSMPAAEPEQPTAEEAPLETINLPGRGSPAHKAEQERIRVLGHELGYGAEVEATLKDGLGAADVVLSNDKLRIAVEVSVTTPAEHEVANILKCLSAGFDYVVATTHDLDHLRAIENLAWKKVAAADIPQVLFLLPEDIEGFLKAHQEEPDETKILGYTVISKKVPKSSEEKRRKRERLAWLLEQARL